MLPWLAVVLVIGGCSTPPAHLAPITVAPAAPQDATPSPSASPDATHHLYDTNPLPGIADHPKSPATLSRSVELARDASAKVKAWVSFNDAEGETIDQAIIELRKAIRTEPANIAAWLSLADGYEQATDTTQLLAVVDALIESACDDCIAYVQDLARGRRGDIDALPTDFAAKIHGRTSSLTTAARAVMTFDDAQLRPLLGSHLSITMNGGTTQLSGKHAIDAWLTKMSGMGRSAEGILTCHETCCRILRNQNEGDNTHYLDQLCFAPGPRLASMAWHIG